jgi:CheY-like chemotaxis protein
MSTHKVLIVEDNTDTAEVLRILLGLWGNEVRVAFNGLDGVAMAQEWEPEVVLCDTGLPGLDGFGVARALRPSGVRLIAVTGYDGEGVRRMAFENGYQAVLVKPADPDELERLLS